MVEINKPKEIYIVTAGEYSDYHIVEVFSNFKEAEKFAESHGGKLVSDEYYVETYIIDRVKYNLPKKYTEYFEVIFTVGGKLEKITKRSDNWYTLDVLPTLKGVLLKVIAKNEEHALKIARDKFVKYQTEKLDL